MGALMAENGGRQLALFDELSAFLIKIKLYSSRGLTDSHELAMFLELYNANPWTRTTGMKYSYLMRIYVGVIRMCMIPVSLPLISLSIHFYINVTFYTFSYG